MKKTTLVVSLSVLVCAVLCPGTFAYNDVPSADEASRAAKESLKNPHRSSSQIGWLNGIISLVSINEPERTDIAAKNNKAIEESKGHY